MKNILVMCTNVFGYNGVAGVILNYYKAIDKEKFHIDMLFMNEPSEDVKKLFEENNTKLFVVKRNSNPIKYMKKIKTIMKENQYDLVHIHGNSATMALELIAAKQANIKVRIPHGHNTTTNHKFIHKLLYGTFEKNYSYGFACGKDVGEWLYDDASYVVINNGVETEKFRFKKEYRDEIRKKYDIEEKFVIGHVGVFNYQKNHKLLIEIFKKLHKKNNNSVLMLVGQGEYFDEIKEIVREEKLEDVVIFVGATGDVHKYMMAFDVMALPSRFEGLPLVLVEAQCTGLLCIASNNVSEDANITGLVDFVDCYNEIDKYVDKLNETNNRKMDREAASNESIKTICLKGYNIIDNAKRLEELYTVYIENSN